MAAGKELVEPVDSSAVAKSTATNETPRGQEPLREVV